MVLSSQELKLVIAGHVDHGKSTIIGRLLNDPGSIPISKIESVKKKCKENSKPFEYAFLLDALIDEQAQGITIDTARIFFKTDFRNYLILDTPGHIEFLKNMITGASWAEAALLVIDAKEGVQENSRRHGYMLSFLGISQICVLVNKMDLVNYKQDVYQEIREEYGKFLSQLGVKPLEFIPVSGIEGDNIATVSNKMSWYKGPTVLEQLDLFESEALLDQKPLRIPVQDVYKFTENGDNRRIISGRIESGQISVGDEVMFFPSGKSSKVKTIESFNLKSRIEKLIAGWTIGFTLEEQIFVKRGEIAVCSDSKKPITTSRFKARIFWLGENALIAGNTYHLKLGTSRSEMVIDSVERVMDASNLEIKNSVEVHRNDIAECIVRLDQIIALDLASEFPETGRFVIVDEYEISGGGVVVENFPDETNWIYDGALKRNQKWESISITDEMRAERYNQKACMVLITGSPKDDYRKVMAKTLTEKLFNEGKFVYFLGMANLLYGMDADIKGQVEDVRSEHIRRLAEVANLMMHTGLILVVSAREITREDMKILKLALTDRGDRLITIWAGDKITTNLNPHLHFVQNELQDANSAIKLFLQKQGYIFGYI